MSSADLESLAILDHAECLEYAQAHRLAPAMPRFSFALLGTVYALNGCPGRAGRNR